jgi:16S rRNA processing protein RimM
MASDRRLVTAGLVGRSHSLDGTFAVERAGHRLPQGTVVHVAGRERRVERRSGTDLRPLVRLAGVSSKEDARALQGEPLLVEDELGEGEWLADDLIGCRVEGLGEVLRIVGGSSCDVLELDDGTLIPLISDAVRAVDVEARRIEVDRRFLKLDEEAS